MQRVLLLACLSGSAAAAATVGLPGRVKHALLRGHDGKTITLDKKEAAEWIGAHMHFVASQAASHIFRESIHGHMGDMDKDDLKRCGGSEPTPEKDTKKMDNAQWNKVVADAMEKYPICHDIGSGVLGTSDLKLVEFDGLVQFQITGKAVRLIVHGSKGASNVATNPGGCDEKVNTLSMKVYINDLLWTSRDMVMTTSWGGLGTSKYKAQTTETGGGITSLNHKVKLEIAVDARLVYIEAGDKWIVRGKPDKSGKPGTPHGHQDIHVCIPDFKISGGITGWFVNAVVGMFGGVKEKIRNAVYCAFKYTIPAAPGLKGLLDFAKTHRALDDLHGRPKIGFAFRNSVDSTKETEEQLRSRDKTKDTTYTAMVDATTQFQMPTRKFIKHLLVKASETAINNQAGLDYGGVAKKNQTVSFGVFCTAVLIIALPSDGLILCSQS